MANYDPLRDLDLQMCSWKMYPMRITEDPKTLEENLVMDSPGFEPRDLRYWPKMEPCDPHEIPTLVELAWVDKIYYEERAKARAEKINDLLDERHERNIHRAFTKQIYNAKPKEYTLYDRWVIENIMEAFDCGIGFYEPDDRFMSKLEDWRAFYEAIDINPDRYISPEERHYRDGVEKVVRFILMAKTQYPGKLVDPTKEVVDAYDEVEFIVQCIQGHVSIDFNKGANSMRVNMDLKNRGDDITFYKRQRFNLRVGDKIIDCFPTDMGKGSKYNITEMPAEKQIEMYRLDDKYRRMITDARRKRVTPGPGQCVLKKTPWPDDEYVPAHYGDAKIRKENEEMRVRIVPSNGKVILAKKPIVKKLTKTEGAWGVKKTPREEYDEYRAAVEAERARIFAEHGCGSEEAVNEDQQQHDDGRSLSRVYYDEDGSPHTETVHFSDEFFDENLRFVQPDFYRDEEPVEEKRPKDLHKYMNKLIKTYYGLQEYIGSINPNKKKSPMKLENARYELRMIEQEIAQVRMMGVPVPKGYKRKGLFKKVKSVFKRKVNSILDWYKDNAKVINVFVGFGVACVNLARAATQLVRGGSPEALPA